MAQVLCRFSLWKILSSDANKYCVFVWMASPLNICYVPVHVR